MLLPTLNEAEGIVRTFDRLPRAGLEAAGYAVETVIVDGGSTDGTVERARARGAQVVEERRRGYGRAYKTALPRTRGQLVVTADADDTYPLDDLPALLGEVRRRGLDFATVNRFARLTPGSMGRRHRFGNAVLSFVTRWLYRVRVRDSQSGMWVLSRRAIERLPWERFSDGMAFSQELKIAAFRDPHLRAAELAGRYYPRVGEPKLDSWTDGLRNLFALIARRFRGVAPR